MSPLYGWKIVIRKQDMSWENRTVGHPTLWHNVALNVSVNATKKNNI